MTFPKKPQLLYAPMLGTLGGGSMRSFGRGTGGGSLFDFETVWLQPDIAINVNTGRSGLNGLNNYKNPNTGAPLNNLIAATTVNPDTNDYYFAQHSSWTGKFQYIVPKTQTYNFELRGAQGRSNTSSGSAKGGRGAHIVGTLDLEKGDILVFVTGLVSPAATDSGESGGGGGASYIYKQTSWDQTSSSVVPLAIAGGGGGAVGNSYGPYPGTDASNIAGGGFNTAPYGGSGVAVNTASGSGGLGGNGTNWINHFGGASNLIPNTHAQHQADNYALDGTSNISIINTGEYNGAAGGGGFRVNGHPGYNSSVGGGRLDEYASGGSGNTTHNYGGFGGGGGGRNTSGGGGGGYIGGSGGNVNSNTWGATINADGAGGVGGSSYVNSTYGTLTSGGYGYATTHTTQRLGLVHFYL